MPPVSNPPPGGGSGQGTGSFAGPLVEKLFRPARPSIPPSEFQGQTILVVFNPTARQGRFAHEAESLQKNLESLGFHVIFLRTVADPTERSRLIRETARSFLSRPDAGPLHLLPVGGDGSIDETVREVVQEITGPLREIPPDSGVNDVVRERIGSVVVANVGTAADIANQLGSPPRFHGLRSFLRPHFLLGPEPHFSGIGAFIRRSQLMPLGIAAVESEVAPGRSAFHSVGFGTSGYLFTQAEANRRAHPDSFMNRGLLGYFRVLPQAVREYGLTGVDVEIEHHGRVDRFRVGELLGSSNRIVAAAGGVPGRWGEFKLIAIPNGPGGVFVMGESIFRGLGTQLGINLVGVMRRTFGVQTAFDLAQVFARRFGIRFEFNMVGADSLLWTLSPERQITLRPGERARLRFFDPATGELTAVPWQLNGDSVPQRTTEAEIYVPPVTVPMRVAPGAVALRLYEQDELRRGLSVSDGGEPPLPIARYIEPPSFHSTLLGGYRATSAFYPASDLRALLTSLNIEPARLPLLVARAHAVSSRVDLSLIQSNSYSMDDVERWVRSEEGGQQIEMDRALLGDTFRNRLETHGVGLALGLGTLYLSDRLLSHAGVDARQDPVLHFSGVALSSHAMNQVGNAWAGVLINRARGIPYDWSMVESRGAQGLVASRMVYETNPSLLRALGTSTVRSLGLEGGAGSVLLRGARNLVGVPARMAWGMGTGIACSRITETILSRYTSLDEDSRRYASMGAFFAPSLYHLAAGNRGLGILESTSMRRLNAVFATGFIADLGFMGMQSVQYGDRASYERWVNHRASALRDAEEGGSGLFSVRGVFQLISPEISTWWDTVDGVDFHRNQYYQRILDADRARVEARFH